MLIMAPYLSDNNRFDTGVLKQSSDCVGCLFAFWGAVLVKAIADEAASAGCKCNSSIVFIDVHFYAREALQKYPE